MFQNKKKREKHATKIPSSRGLFIVASSCFFVSGPRVKKKRRGKKRKEKISKKITGKKRIKKRISKKEKKQEQKNGHMSKSSRLAMVCLSFPLVKKKNSTKTKASHRFITRKDTKSKRT